MNAPTLVRRVTLARIDIVPSCTVATGVGRDIEGNEVTFTTDWRSALALAEALEAGEPIEVYLHDSQVITWWRATCR